MKAIGIYRAKRFSPGKSAPDKAILDAVLTILKDNGWEVEAITEEELTEHRSFPDTCPKSARYLPDTCKVLTMARSESALHLLRDTGCLNSPEGIRACLQRRYLIDATVDSSSNHFPCWLKRADGCAEKEEDVSYCETSEELEKKIEGFKKRGIDRWVIQPHYKGDLVKFYGVEGTEFLHTSYPTETGQTKFGLESHNDGCRHLTYNREELKRKADKIAWELNVPVYGGDAVIDTEGEINIIDFNDWPSFSPCREEAARAIAEIC